MPLTVKSAYMHSVVQTNLYNYDPTDCFFVPLLWSLRKRNEARSFFFGVFFSDFFTSVSVNVLRVVRAATKVKGQGSGVRGQKATRTEKERTRKAILCATNVRTRELKTKFPSTIPFPVLASRPSAFRD